MTKRNPCRLALAGATLLLLSACGDDKPAVNKSAGEAQQLAAGEYQVTAKVASLTALDKARPATRLKAGDSVTMKACVDAAGVPDPALFSEAGDRCTIDSKYISGAILSLGLKCSRPANRGVVTSAVDGSFTADTFSAKVTTGTSFYGDGDYQLVRNLSGKRIGACPPATAKAK